MAYDTTESELHIAVWYFNEGFWTDLGRMEEVMMGRDMLHIAETHHSLEKYLP